MNNNRTIDYPEDVTKISSFLSDRGITMSQTDIQKEYRHYCENTDSAGWLEPDEFRLECFYAALTES